MNRQTPKGIFQSIETRISNHKKNKDFVSVAENVNIYANTLK